MKTISVSTGRPYQVLIGQHLIQKTGEFIKPLTGAQTAVIVTDDIVESLYAKTVQDSLNQAGFRTAVFSFPNGEPQKCHTTLIALYEFLCQQQVTRKDIIVALGGGVVGDLAGYATATYLRGMDFIQIPTTLLAQIDSSVGGKTGIDIASGKNLVGAFWQPRLVLCDTDTLSTLSEEIFADGMAEAIKYGAIKDRALFEQIAQGNIKEHLADMIARCVQIKADVVKNDEFDTGERMLLNFGHTFGHSIEKHYHFSRYTHGSAVAIGMVKISRLAESYGITPPGTAKLLEDCCKAYSLPTEDDIPDDKLIEGCLNDKKRAGGTLRLILLRDMGDAFIEPVSIDDFKRFVKGEYRHGN